jgi:hypothetical protein
MCGPSPPSPLSPKVHGTLLSSRTTDTPIRTRVCSYYSSRPPPKSGDLGDNGDRPRDLSIRDTNTDEDCDTHDDELQRFAKGVATPYFEMIDAVMGREGWERKADKGRRRCEVRTFYSSPNTSSATPIDGARHPVWVSSNRYFERASIIDGKAFVKGLLPCSFLYAILELQSSETRHPQSPLATILPRSGRSPRSSPRR